MRFNDLCTLVRHTLAHFSPLHLPQSWHYHRNRIKPGQRNLLVFSPSLSFHASQTLHLVVRGTLKEQHLVQLRNMWQWGWSKAWRTKGFFYH